MDEDLYTKWEKYKDLSLLLRTEYVDGDTPKHYGILQEILKSAIDEDRLDVIEHVLEMFGILDESYLDEDDNLTYGGKLYSKILNKVLNYSYSAGKFDSVNIFQTYGGKTEQNIHSEMEEYNIRVEEAKRKIADFMLSNRRKRAKELESRCLGDPSITYRFGDPESWADIPDRFIIHDNKYCFDIREIVYLISATLSNMEKGLPFPKLPINPYTRQLFNIEFLKELYERVKKLEIPVDITVKLFLEDISDDFNSNLLNNPEDEVETKNRFIIFYKKNDLQWVIITKIEDTNSLNDVRRLLAEYKKGNEDPVLEADPDKYYSGKWVIFEDLSEAKKERIETFTAQIYSMYDTKDPMDKMPFYFIIMTLGELLSMKVGNEDLMDFDPKYRLE